MIGMPAHDVIDAAGALSALTLAVRRWSTRMFRRSALRRQYFDALNTIDVNLGRLSDLEDEVQELRALIHEHHGPSGIGDGNADVVPFRIAP